MTFSQRTYAASQRPPRSSQKLMVWFYTLPSFSLTRASIWFSAGFQNWLLWEAFVPSLWTPFPHSHISISEVFAGWREAYICIYANHSKTVVKPRTLHASEVGGFTGAMGCRQLLPKQGSLISFHKDARKRKQLREMEPSMGRISSPQSEGRLKADRTRLAPFK